MKGKIFFLILVFGFLFNFNFVLAHLDSGKDIIKNGYIIDFGFSPTHAVSLTPENFAVNLVNETSEKLVDVTSIWTRISLSDEVVFSGEFFPKNASLPFTFTFPSGGNYSIDFQFRNNGEVVESQTFYLDVKDANSIDTIYYVLGFVVLFGLLFLKNYFFRKKLKELGYGKK